MGKNTDKIKNFIIILLISIIGIICLNFIRKCFFLLSKETFVGQMGQMRKKAKTSVEFSLMMFDGEDDYCPESLSNREFQLWTRENDDEYTPEIGTVGISDNVYFVLIEHPKGYYTYNHKNKIFFKYIYRGKGTPPDIIILPVYNGT